MEHRLNKDEIAYLYELLYEYEHESHAGYQDDKVIEKIGNDISLDSNHEIGDNIATAKKNVLQFTPYRNNKCWAILYHLRNALAHGNIQSVDDDKYFLIKDYSDRSKRKVRNMLTLIEKDKFYSLIKAISDTRKNAKVRKKKSKKAKK